MYITVQSIRGNEWIMDKYASGRYTSLNKFHMGSKFFRFYFTVNPHSICFCYLYSYNGSYRATVCWKNIFLFWTSFRCDDKYGDGCDDDDDDGYYDDDKQKKHLSLKLKM